MVPACPSYRGSTVLYSLLPSPAAILVLSILSMSYVDTSAIYHRVRAQSVIKLYVIYNMLEVYGVVCGYIQCTYTGL